jgi:hypothetical protein
MIINDNSKSSSGLIKIKNVQDLEVWLRSGGNPNQGFSRTQICAEDNLKNSDGCWTPLTWFVFRSVEDGDDSYNQLIDPLLKEGANPCKVNYLGWNAWDYATRFGDCNQVVMELFTGYKSLCEENLHNCDLEKIKCIGSEANVSTSEL